MNSDINMLHLIEALLSLSMVVMIGLYFIFSNTIMSALKVSKQGANTMVEINKVILNPVFLMCFFLSAISALYFMLFGEWQSKLSGALFFFGTVVVTVVKNVPLNNQLRDSVNDSKFAKHWHNYFF